MAKSLQEIIAEKLAAEAAKSGKEAPVINTTATKSLKKSSDSGCI